MTYKAEREEQLTARDRQTQQVSGALQPRNPLPDALVVQRQDIVAPAAWRTWTELLLSYTGIH